MSRLAEIFYINFIHFVSFTVSPNYFYSSFEIFPEHFGVFERFVLVISEVCGLISVFLFGIIFKYLSRWRKVIEKTDSLSKVQNYITFPKVLIFFPLCFLDMLLPSIIFLIGAKFRQVKIKQLLIVIFVTRLIVNSFGLFY